MKTIKKGTKKLDAKDKGLLKLAITKLRKGAILL